MVEAPRFDEHPDAAGGPAADSDAARPSLIRDESGATAIEYALIASLASVMIVAGATAIGTSLTTIFQSIAGAF